MSVTGILKVQHAENFRAEFAFGHQRFHTSMGAILTFGEENILISVN
jgi:hypothetical protein